MPGMPLAICLKVASSPAASLPLSIEAVGRVVGGHHLEGAVLHAPPDRRAIPGIARRRAEHPLGALEPGLVEVLRTEQQILRAGLGKHLLAARLGLADRRHGTFGRDVEHHDRLVDQRRHRDQPGDRLGLGEPRMADRVVARRGVAPRQQALGHPAEHRVVLGVHRDHRTRRARQRQQIQHLLVGQAQQGIGHEQLERGIALADQLRQLGHDRLARVRDDHVEGVIDHGLLRALAVVGDDLDHRGAAVLGGERDHRRGAAERRRCGAAREVIGIPDPHAGELLDVAMTVDPARQHEPAAGVDFLGPPRQVLGERHDPPAAHADVAGEAVDRSDHGTVANHEIETLHGNLRTTGPVNHSPCRPGHPRRGDQRRSGRLRGRPALLC